jgi:hypothetical protein
MVTIIKASISCNTCGAKITGGHQTNERLAAKNAISKLREHEKICDLVKNEIKNFKINYIINCIIN